MGARVSTFPGRVTIRAMNHRWRESFTVLLLALACGTAGALDLQGHRGARGLAPENTLAAFA